MNPTLKKIGQGIALAVLAAITAYSLFLFGGFGMFILLATTAPVTMAWESVALDYTVWAIIVLISLWPFGKLVIAKPQNYRAIARGLGWMLAFSLAGSSVATGAMMLPWPGPLVEAVPLVSTLLIMVGFYWYTRKITTLLLK